MEQGPVPALDTFSTRDGRGASFGTCRNTIRWQIGAGPPPPGGGTLPEYPPPPRRGDRTVPTGRVSAHASGGRGNALAFRPFVVLGSKPAAHPEGHRPPPYGHTVARSGTHPRPVVCGSGSATKVQIAVRCQLNADRKPDRRSCDTADTGKGVSRRGHRRSGAAGGSRAPGGPPLPRSPPPSAYCR